MSLFSYLKNIFIASPKTPLQNERENFRNLFRQTPEMVVILAGPEHRFEFVNEAHVKVLGFDATGMTVREAQPESVELHGILDEVYRTGKTAELHEIPATVGKSLRRFNLTYAARKDERGLINGIMVLGIEVSEEVALRDKLLELQERFQKSVQATSLGVWYCDLPFDELTWNREVREHFFMTPVERVTMDKFYEHIHPEDRDRTAKAIQKSIDNKTAYDIVYRTIDPKNSSNLKFIRAMGWTDYNKEGQPIRFDGITLDVTKDHFQAVELKKAKEEAEKSEGQLKFALEAGAMGTWVVNLKTGEVNLSEESKILFGFSRDKINVDQTIDAVIHPDDREAARETLQRAITEDKLYYSEYRIIRPTDAKQCWILATGSVHKDSDGVPELLSGVIMDITERKLAEQDLAEKNAFFETVLEQMPMSALFCEAPSGRLLFVNNRFQKVWRRPPGEIKTIADFSLYTGYHADGSLLAPTEWPLARSITTGEVVLNEDIKVKMVDGSFAVMRFNSAPVKNSKGEIIAGVVLSEDVTDYKNQQADLRAAKDQAESANRLKSAFLANMSHEIRTPLGAMLGFADLLRDKSLSDAERANFIDILSRNGESLSVIINDILDLSKVEAGHVALNIASVNPEKVISEAISLLQMKAQQKKLSLTYQSESTTPATMMSDANRIRQIILNLIGNAIKFTQSGTIQVRTYGSVNGVGRLYIEVTDTGIGIPRLQQEKVFEMFIQGDDSMTRQFGGTGLGLALSRSLARALGGDVSIVKSEQNVGTTFLVSLSDQVSTSVGPKTVVQKQASGNGATEPNLGPQTLSGVNVLVVDDSMDNQNLISRYLKRHGANVSSAQNGLVGYESARNGNFDLVLMDLQMPVMDGYTATQKLREAGYEKPIVAVTAHAMGDALERCLAAGCSDHLTKPINPKQLVSTISKYVGR